MPPIDVSWAPVEAPGGVRPGFPPQMPSIGAGGVGSGASIPPSAPPSTPFLPTNTLMSRLGQVGRVAGTGMVGLGALDTISKASQGLIPETIASGLGTLGGLSARFGVGGGLGRLVASNPYVGAGLMMMSGNNAGEDRPISAEDRAMEARSKERTALEGARQSYGVMDPERLADMGTPFDPSRFQGPGGMLSRTAFAPPKRKGPPGNAGRSKPAGTYTGDTIEPMNLAPPGMKYAAADHSGMGSFQLRPPSAGLGDVQLGRRRPLLPTPGQSETGGAADFEDTLDNMELLQLLRQQMGERTPPRRPRAFF